MHPTRLFALTLIAIVYSSLSETPRCDAQDLPPQPVGGLSTNSSAGSSGSSSLRRRLPTLTSVPEDFSNLPLSPGFLLAMDVYDTPEVSTELRIDPHGDVLVPLIGTVHVEGQTVTQAAASISSRLREGGFLNAPQVSLNVIEYAGTNVTVLGEVRSPGRIELLAPRSLAEVLAMSGGKTLYAGNLIEIVHLGASFRSPQTVRSYRGSDSIVGQTLILPGDVVTVRRAGIVYVLGAVNRPGGYVMQEDGDLNVTEALSLAYGTNMQAAVASMHLVRQLADGRVEDLPIPYRDIVNGRTASPRLQSGDLLYVPVSKVKTILGAGLLATAAQAAIYLH